VDAEGRDLVQGTLEMLVLKTLALESMHGYGIALRIEQISKGVFRVNRGPLLPAAELPGACGADSGRMARVGKQPPGEILRTDSRRSLGVGAGAPSVGPPGRRHQPDS
jgi:hypothetical protein